MATGYTKMGTTTPVTIRRHVLPGEEEGSIAWFHRQNGFEQQEIFRRDAFKRSRWSHLPDGQWSRCSPRILPGCHEWLVDIILSYLDENNIPVKRSL